MLTKKIQIEFANPSIRAVDHIQDIRKAAKNAGLNLFARHDVQLQYPMLDGNRVVVDIYIPDEMAENFSIGYHLRGISSFLLNRCGDRYQSYLVGRRLLNYIEVKDSCKESTGLEMVDRLESVAAFAKLLERSDEESLDRISRILDILKEAKQLW